MVKKIKFTIDSEGEVSLSVEGAVGKECEFFTEPFESELGTISQRELKDSYYDVSEKLEEATTQEI